MVGCGGWTRLRTREGGSTVRAEPQKALGGGSRRVKKYTRERKPLQGTLHFPCADQQPGFALLFIYFLLFFFPGEEG